ncbi:hypothetical protein ACW9H6_11875 [Pseudomonas sp. SDO528_S397]
MKAQVRFLSFLLVSLLAFSVNAQTDSTALCPSKKFSQFLDAFAESVPVQEAFTNAPLKKLITVDAEPEPRQETLLVEKEKIAFPVLPNKENRGVNGLNLQVIDNKGDTATVRLEKPDTDYQVIYVFKLLSCWRLDEVKDYSL